MADDTLPTIKRADADILSGLTIDSGYGGMEKAVKGMASVPGLTETILPSIQKLLQGSESSYMKNIDLATQGNVASAQTDAMRRGLTGSDIEAASMIGARGQGEMAKSNYLAQNAQSLAGYIKELATGDISSQRENLMMMAQLMGQKISNDQDLQMFREMLQANAEQADKNRKNALWGAGIGAVGSIAGAGITKFSDERLKVGITRIGTAGPVAVYAFRWKKAAQAFLGAHDKVEVGVMAQDVEAHYPRAVKTVQGWKAVDYTMLPSRVVDEINRLGVAHA